MDETTGQPLADALVHVEDVGLRALSDASGLVSLGPLGAGSYRITVERFGYEPVSGNIEVPGSDNFRVLLPRASYDDPAKSEANLEERGFDFEFATLVFEGPTLEVQDRRHDYGEARIVAIGLADGLELTVIYTDRRDSSGGVIRRIISARRSNRRERKAYKAGLKDGSESGPR
jgi:hypothetical protein